MTPLSALVITAMILLATAQAIAGAWWTVNDARSRRWVSCGLFAIIAMGNANCAWLLITHL